MKAILVIDVDEKSIGREVNYIRVQGNGYSYIVKAVGEDVRLKPLPQKRTQPKYEDSISLGFRNGWNACLQEITGETE